MEPTQGEVGAAAPAAAVVDEGKRQAKEVGGALIGRLLSEADRRKGQVADKLEGLASQLDRLGSEGKEESFGGAQQWLGKATPRVRSMAATLQTRSSAQLLDDARTHIRSRPGLYLAGCFAAGIFVARLLRE